MQIFLVRNKLNINYNGLTFSKENENPQPIKGKKRVVKEHSLILKQKKILTTIYINNIVQEILYSNKAKYLVFRLATQTTLCMKEVQQY